MKQYAIIGKKHDRGNGMEKPIIRENKETALRTANLLKECGYSEIEITEI